MTLKNYRPPGAIPGCTNPGRSFFTADASGMRGLSVRLGSTLNGARGTMHGGYMTSEGNRFKQSPTTEE